MRVEGVGEVSMDEATNSMTIRMDESSMGSSATKLAVSAVAGAALLMF